MAHLNTFEFTAFNAQTLFDGTPREGMSFVNAVPTVQVTAMDNDSRLSGDFPFTDISLDRNGQTATIADGGAEIGSGRIYVERSWTVSDAEGNKYELFEIEQEGSDTTLLTFGGEVPAPGTELTLGRSSDFVFRGPQYDELGAGDLAPNIVDIALGSPDFSILVMALSAADLVETVQGLTDITVFAPTNAAFAALATDLGYAGDTSDPDAVFGFIADTLSTLGGGDPIPLLTDILLYHVSAGAKSEAEITDAESIQTLLTDASFATEGGELIDNDPNIANPEIVVPDVAALNGTVQVIDRVLLPIDVPNVLPDVIDTATDAGSFSILLAALDAAGLTETVRNLDDITVFAPTDAAFSALAVDLGFAGDTGDTDAVFGFVADTLSTLGGGDPIPLLTDILLFHVSPGAKTAAQINAADAVGTLLGDAAFTATDGVLMDADPDLTDPTIAAPDVFAANGTIQVIDRVLLPIDVPPIEPELPSLAEIVAESGGVFDENAADFDLLLLAADAAGLVPLLSDPDADLTVFAPNDGAFVALSQGLGFEGSDEEGAFGYLVDALELLGKGDAIGLLGTVLAYHVAEGTLDADAVLGSSSIDTLAGASFGVDGLSLVDADPDVADPNIIATNLFASNGVAHVIDGVLLPVDLDVTGAGPRVDFIIDDDSGSMIVTRGGDDMVSGKGGDDRIALGSGDDTGLGGEGNDKLEGNSGDDHLLGGAGNDILRGGTGDDMLTGDEGNDIFIFREFDGEDTITDFTSGEDRVNLRSFELADFEELLTFASETPEGVEFDFGPETLILNGVAIDDLAARDFLI